MSMVPYHVMDVMAAQTVGNEFTKDMSRSDAANVKQILCDPNANKSAQKIYHGHSIQVEHNATRATTACDLQQSYPVAPAVLYARGTVARSANANKRGCHPVLVARMMYL